ncbi:hypothetical protein Q3H58_003377 [Pseudomonas psychrotolerans]|nr:hypothetical protein [Pseudomonas psychrotolerans]
MGPGHAGQRQLLAGLIAKGDEMAAEDQPPAVAAQVAGLGQGGDQAMGGAAGAADGGANLRQAVGASGHGVEYRQAAKQRLGPAGRFALVGIVVVHGAFTLEAW